MDDVRRIEHLFSMLGGVPVIFPPTPRSFSVINDDGSILLILPDGLSADARATELAGAILRHAAARLDPVELALLLQRALTGRVADRVAATAASVARWIPEG